VRSRTFPLPDNSVDVIISNCVINLSADKNRVLREAFRVLKPGDRFAVSDVVTRGDIPLEIRNSILLWVGCIAGALEGIARALPQQALSRSRSNLWARHPRKQQGKAAFRMPTSPLLSDWRRLAVALGRQIPIREQDV